jgi:hypothetical protein
LVTITILCGEINTPVITLLLLEARKAVQSMVLTKATRVAHNVYRSTHYVCLGIDTMCLLPWTRSCKPEFVF